LDLPEGLSSRIAAHVAEFPVEALPESTLHAAKRALLDGLGVMLAASGESADVRPFVEHAVASGAGPARVLGHDAFVSAEMAAFANGAMAHALDFEDAFDAAPSHPNASALPAVLALAEAQGAVGGRELLTAIAIGCDLVCRMGLSLRREMEAGGWYPPPILGAFGATAAAARLLRLDATRTRDAFSLTLCQAVMPGEIKYSRDTVIRAIREAFPAQAAVKSALLARAGVQGFEAPFEGKAGFFRLYAEGQFAPDAMLDGLGERFWIDQLTFKRWPACRGTHAYIQAAQALRAEHGFAAGDITGIVATGGAVQRMLVEPTERKQAPATVIDAKFSIPYTIAAALLDAEVTLESFAPARIAEAERRRIAGLVAFEQHPDWGRAQAASGVLALTLRDGRTVEQGVEIAAGHPLAPLSDAALTAKFIDCAGRAYRPLDTASAQRMADAIWSIDGACDAAATLFAE
jgi:2-methylcitrate dehydratase PrpD